MKKWIKDRNNWHYIVGFFSAGTTYLVAFEAYQMIGRFLICTIAVLFGSTLWEMIREDKYGYPFDKKDIVRSVVGALIGGVVAVGVHLIIIGKFI